MAHFIFLCRRFFKSKRWLAFIGLAMLLTGINLSYQQSNSIQNEYFSDSNDGYFVQLTNLSAPNVNHLSFYEQFTLDETPSAARLAMYDFMSESIDMTSPMNDPTDISPEYTLEYYQHIENIINEEQIDLTSDEKLSLKYAQVISQHEVEQLNQNEKYSPEGASQWLVRGFNIQFGIIAIIFLGLLLITFVVEEIDQKRLQIDRTLPQSTFKSFSAYLSFGSLLIVGYFLLSVILVVIGSFVITGGVGDWMYPVRTLIPHLSILPSIGVIIIQLLFFYLKTLILMSLMLMITLIVRNRDLALNLNLMISIFAGIMTYLIPAFQTNNNPWFVDFRHQFLGRQITTQDTINQTVQYLSAGELFNLSSLLIHLVLGITLMIVSYYLYRQLIKRRDDQSKTNIASINKWTFEARKLRHYLSNATFVNILVSTTFTILFVMVFQTIQLDQDDYINSALVDASSTTIDAGVIIDHFENQLDEIDTELAKTNDKEYEYFLLMHQQSIIPVLEVYQEEYQTLQDRTAYFETGDINYYDTFEKDLTIFFNPNSMYNEIDHLADYYRPKEDYYESGNFPSKYGYELSKARLEELKERQIKPVKGLPLTLTPLDQAVSLSDKVNDHLSSQFYEESFYSYWYRLIHVYRFDIIFVGLIMILVNGAYTFEGRQRTKLSLNYTLPQSRQQILWRKWSWSLIRTFSILLFVIVAFVLISRGQLGQGNIPIPYYLQEVPLTYPAELFEQSFKWIDLSQWVIQSLWGLTLIGALISILLLYVSTWIESSINLILLTTVGISGLYSLYHVTNYQWFAYTPIPFLNLSSFLDGSYIFNHSVDLGTMTQFSIVFISWIVLLYVATHLRVNRHSLIGGEG